MQATASQLLKGSATSGQEVPPVCQLTNRKARSTKQLDLQSQSLAGSSLPHRGLGPEDAEYANLIGAMDNDLERPEQLSSETLPEPSPLSIQNKGTHIWFYQNREEQEASGATDRYLRRVFIICSVGIQREAAGQSKSPEEEGRQREKINHKDSGRRAQR